MIFFLNGSEHADGERQGLGIDLKVPKGDATLRFNLAPRRSWSTCIKKIEVDLQAPQEIEDTRVWHAYLHTCPHVCPRTCLPTHAQPLKDNAKMTSRKFRRLYEGSRIA